MAQEKNEEKKIIIDEDWKSQAQKDKEALKAKEQEEKTEEPKAEAQERGPLPPADFAGLVSMLATQAFWALGVIRSQEDQDKQIPPDLPMAKFHIDMLGMLEEKCKGNLSSDEERMLKNTLDQLRMTFVSLSK